MTTKAIGVGDLVYARSRRFRQRVDRALALVAKAAELGTVGICFSGGKDSTVLLDLVRRVIPGAPAGFFDCDCELPVTNEIVNYYGVERIHTQRTLREMCAYGGYWGHRNPVDADAEFDFGHYLVFEPSARFVAKYDLVCLAIGLRAGESTVRRLNAAQRGELYQLKNGEWHLCPLTYWTDDDVWAYIASRELRYNEAYDRMTEIGMSRKAQRVGLLLGSTGARTEGRYAWLRQCYPRVFAELAAEFPKIVTFT